MFRDFHQASHKFTGQKYHLFQLQAPQYNEVLVGITPCGAVSFLSKCWGGRVSDKELTLNSGFLDHLEYGDQVISSCSILTTLLSTVFAFVLATSMETKLCKIFVETGYETYMGTLAFYVK